MVSFRAEKVYFGCCFMAKKMERLPDLGSLIKEVRNSGLKTRSLGREQVSKQAILTSLRLPLVYVIWVMIPENATLVFRSIEAWLNSLKVTLYSAASLTSPYNIDRQANITPQGRPNKGNHYAIADCKA